MATRRTPIELDDILDLPLPEGVSGYELVNGELVPVSPASYQHGYLIVEVSSVLYNYVKEHGTGGKVISDVGFVLQLPGDPRRLRGPDVAYISQERFLQHGSPGPHFARFIPDLAIEIDLRSKRKPGGLQRIRDYLEAGVPLVWAIDPRKRSATVYRRNGSTTKLTERDSLDGEDVIPGFRLPLAELFS